MQVLSSKFARDKPENVSVVAENFMCDICRCKLFVSKEWRNTLNSSLLYEFDMSLATTAYIVATELSVFRKMLMIKRRTAVWKLD